MIKTINMKDGKILLELFKLQRASYLIEAHLIHFFEIPPLNESLEDLRDSSETFLGYFEGKVLAGALSFTEDKGEIEICRLIVHPDFFRNGIAQCLLNELFEQQRGISVFKVSTGKDNTPAKRLYEKNNFTFVEDLEVASGFFISRYKKHR